ncbi:hypothetical protein [Shewanella algae]|uniref:hypothetical protein n=1 Tax=Shewanella algae TaxID=38313 RepID=UPI003007281C
MHSFNRYAYVNNNPYKYVDPDGEFALALFAPPPPVAGGSTLGEVPPPKITAEDIIDGAGMTGNPNLMALSIVIVLVAEKQDSDGNQGKKPQDSSKNSKHGKNGRAGKGDKAQDQVADLEKQLESATGKKEKDKIKQKLKNIKKNNDRKNKGEEHGKRNKKQ